MRAAQAYCQWDEALELSANAFEHFPRDPWIWMWRIRCLAAVGREREFRAVMEGRPRPDPRTNVDHFAGWLWVLRGLELEKQAALAVADPIDSALLLRSLSGSRLLGYAARDVGEPLDAVRWMRVAAAASDAPLWVHQQLFEVAMWAGDFGLMEAVMATLVRMQPHKPPWIERLLMNEARLHRSAIRRLAEAARLPHALRLHAIGSIVLDEPACTPAALAWIAQYRADRMPDRPLAGGPHGVPDTLSQWEATSAALNGHESSATIVHDHEVRAELMAALPDNERRMLMRLPVSAQTDLLRLLALSTNGGWWAGAECELAPKTLGMPGAGAVAVLAGLMRVSTRVLGATRGHAAIEAALNAARSALQEPMPRPDAAAATGETALALGIAQAGASQIRETDRCDIVLLSPQAVRRLAGLAWPN
jgi:hypothetical protein